MCSHQPPLLAPPKSRPPAKAAGPLVPLDAQKVLSPRAWTERSLHRGKGTQLTQRVRWSLSGRRHVALQFS